LLLKEVCCTYFEVIYCISSYAVITLKNMAR